MSPGDDPDTSSVVWTSPLYVTNTEKWTSTISNRLLIEGGFSMNLERYENLDQPGIAQPWGTAAWLAAAPYRDNGFGTTSHAASVATGGGEYQKSPDRYNVQGSVSYVTGSHSVKVGSRIRGAAMATRSGRTPISFRSITPGRQRRSRRNRQPENVTGRSG